MVDEAHGSQAARDRRERGVLVLKSHGEEEVLGRRDPTDLVRGALEGGAGLDRGLIILWRLGAHEDLAPALPRGPELLPRNAPAMRLDAVAVALVLMGETDGETGRLCRMVAIEAEGLVQDVSLAADGVVEAVKSVQEGRLEALAPKIAATRHVCSCHGEPARGVKVLSEFRVRSRVVSSA